MDAARLVGDLLFLVVRNLETGATDVKTFDDQDMALQAYTEAERQHEQETILGLAPSLEIVLIQGESLERVRASYPQYFTEGSRADRRRQVVQEMADLLPA